MGERLDQEHLRRLLREADAAAGEPPPLGIDEREPLRRRILAEAAAHKRPVAAWLPRSALAGVAAGALVLAAVLVPRLLRQEPDGTPMVAESPSPPLAWRPPEIELPAGPEATEAPRLRKEHPQTALAHNRHTPPPTAEAKREPVQVRFTAPSGTQIVWTLDPQFELAETSG